MDKSKKILLLSLLPVLLTIIFILYVLVPSIGNFSKVSGELKSEKAAFSMDQNELQALKSNKKLIYDVENLRNELADFDVMVPEEDNLAILLVDLEKFANSFNVKLIAMDSAKEKEIRIADSKKAQDKAKTKRNKKSNKEKGSISAKLIEIPVEIKVLGRYPDVLNFINNLERYQRRITINGISVSNYKKDKDVSKSRVQMDINSVIYKLEKEIDNSNELKKEDKS